MAFHVQVRSYLYAVCFMYINMCLDLCDPKRSCPVNVFLILCNKIYEGWNFNSGNYLFTTDTKQIHVSKFYCPSM